MILTDLNQHLSYHQLYCLLAHFITSNKSEKTEKAVIGFLHGLIALKTIVNQKIKVDLVDRVPTRLSHNLKINSENKVII
jgi:hypothetical protein